MARFRYFALPALGSITLTFGLFALAAPSITQLVTGFAV